MALISTKINDIIYFLLKNIEMVKQDNKIFDAYVRNDKELKISSIEKIFYKSGKKIRKILNQCVFWSEFLPFTLDFILFIGIYFIFEDKFNHIKNLLIIGNVREVFHYIRQLWYRNTVGYYNEEDFLDIEIETLIKRIDGIVLENDSFKDLYEDYYLIINLYKKNIKIFEENEIDKNEIEVEQGENELFKKSFNWDIDN